MRTVGKGRVRGRKKRQGNVPHGASPAEGTSASNDAHPLTAKPLREAAIADKSPDNPLLPPASAPPANVPPADSMATMPGTNTSEQLRRLWGLLDPSHSNQELEPALNAISGLAGRNTNEQLGKLLGLLEQLVQAKSQPTQTSAMALAPVNEASTSTHTSNDKASTSAAATLPDPVVTSDSVATGTMTDAQSKGKMEFDLTLEFMKRNPSKFMGNSDPEGAEKWISEMMSHFSTFKCTDDEKVRLVVQLLADDARVWWNSSVREHGGNFSVVTWADFLSVFIGKYIPNTVKSRMLDEFLKLKQETSVLDYERAFNFKSAFAQEYISTNSAKRDKFIEGLNHYLSELVMAAQPATYEQAVELARKFEQQRLNHGDKKRKMHASDQIVKEITDTQAVFEDPLHEQTEATRKGGERTYTEPACASETLDTKQAFKRQKSTHSSVHPKKKSQLNEVEVQQKPKTQLQKRKCFHCKQPGHIWSNCPQKSGHQLKVTETEVPDCALSVATVDPGLEQPLAEALAEGLETLEMKQAVKTQKSTDSSGNPKKSKLKEGQTQQKPKTQLQKHICLQCRQPGHIRRNCPQSIVHPRQVVETQVPDFAASVTLVIPGQEQPLQEAPAGSADTEAVAAEQVPEQIEAVASEDEENSSEPNCAAYEKEHLDKFQAKIIHCFHCNQEGHMRKNCPRRKDTGDMNNSVDPESSRHELQGNFTSPVPQKLLQPTDGAQPLSYFPSCARCKFRHPGDCSLAPACFVCGSPDHRWRNCADLGVARAMEGNVESRRIANANKLLVNEISGLGAEITRIEQDCHTLSQSLSEVVAEKELLLKNLFDLNMKGEAQLRESEGHRSESLHLQSKIQHLETLRDEMTGQLQSLSKELNQLQQENKNIPSMQAELLSLREELARTRSCHELESKAKLMQLEHKRAMEMDLVAMRQQAEHLRAELAKRGIAPAPMAGSYSSYHHYSLRS